MFFFFGKDLGGRKGLAPCMKRNTMKMLTTSHVVERSSDVCLHGCVIFQLPYSELHIYFCCAAHCSPLLHHLWLQHHVFDFPRSPRIRFADFLACKNIPGFQ